MAVLQRLDEATLRRGSDELAAGDERLAGLLTRNGYPPLRLRPTGFATLFHLIVQQQVSRASADAVLARVRAACDGDISPRCVKQIGPARLRRLGLSNQKAAFADGVADSVQSGELDFERLALLGDHDAIVALQAQRGVGPWTASTYVLLAMGRPDVWPPGDRALLVSLGRMLGRAVVPASEEAAELAKAWSPWRAVAARLLWHDYAAVPRR